MKRWLLLLLGALLWAEPSFATMYKATVVSWHASLMVSQGSRMTPVMTVNQGASLQVSDVTKNGWRQVLMRGNRWGWVAENEIMVGAETSVKNLPPVSRSRSTVESRQDFSAAALVVSTKGGYMMPLGSSGGPTFGLDIGFNLTGTSFGKVYLSAQAGWASASASPLGFPGSATYPFLQAGVIVRRLMSTGLYGGALVGVSLIGVTVGSASASTLQYSMSGLLGYDFRLSRLLSVGPEAALSDIALGGHTSALFQGAIRFHF
jgi:hypothetical protein